jgi:hypothetical protein
MPETTPLPPCIPGVPWDQMEMHVHDRLSGSLTHIDPDIVAGWMVPGIQMFFQAMDQGQYCRLFFPGHIKERGYVAERDNQHMPPAYRVDVRLDIGKFIPGYDVFCSGVAERARSFM